MKYKLTLILALFILCSSVVAAGSFEISTQAMEDKINIDQEARFLLTIQNNLPVPQDYKLTFGDVGLWKSYYTDPLSDYFSGINGVQPGEEYTTKIILKPIEQMGLGYHNFAVKIEEVSSGAKKSVELPVYIKSINPNDQDYLPHITVNPQLSKRIDPRKDTELRLVLINKNRKNLTNVEVRLDSNLIKRTLSTSIEPLDTTILNIPLGIDPLHPPVQDTMYVTVSVGQYRFTPDPIQFEVIDYSSEFLLEREEIDGFLMNTDKRVYINDGNVHRGEIIKIETSLLGDIFASSTPNPDQIISEEGKRYRAWNVNLAPGESFNLDLYVSYRIFFYLLIIGIVGYYTYIKLKSPIIVTKEAKNVEMREGGISEVKILLNIKNTSNMPIERINIVDKVPNIANITSDYDAGTLKPTKVMKHAGKGSTIVQWDVEELDANEDRLIVYRIKSRLTILGKFSLPLAMVKFHTKSGKLHKVFSNRLIIGKS